MKGMVVLEHHPKGMRLVERRPRQPVAVAGVLFLALALLPVMNDGPLTAYRLGTAFALALVAAFCFAAGLPRPKRRPLPPRAVGQRLVLSGTSNIEGYAVDLIAPSGATRGVLSGADPGRVLSDGLALSTELGVPLEPGWGLGRTALREFGAPSRPMHFVEPLLVNHRIVPDQAIGTGTAFWGAAFIPAATLVLAVSPARPNLTPSVLAFVLPGLTALYALGVGLWLLGLRETLRFEGSRLTRRRHWFGRGLGKQLETAGVCALYPVAPLGERTHHLLIATETGPIAFPTDPQAGLTVSSYLSAHERAAGRAAE
jgi:hypothetical protein